MPNRATFLGASITNFQTSIGWGSQTSQLTVTLVEDFANGDNFAPGNVGDPCYFSYNSVTFGGLLQSYRKKYGESSNPIYEVTVIDPRGVLEGVQLILDDYNGDVSGIPNLYNIYKYWEDTGFGNSLRNDTGMPWGKVLNGYLAVEAGKPISFRGSTYTIDFTNILAMWLSTDYRIGGESISMLQLLDEVCSAAGCDYYVTLEAGEIINIYTISRRITPVSGAIDAFVTSQDGVNAKESGMELRNEATTKFLVGGQQQYFYFQWYSSASGDRNPALNNIWPYWGTNLDGDVIFGSGVDGSHRLTLDTRSVRDNVVGSTYKTDTDELRAAMVGEDAWMRFLLGKSNEPTSIHYTKATTFEMASSAGDWESIVSGKTKDEVRKIKWSEYIGAKADQVSNLAHNNPRFQRIHSFYVWLSQYARQFYGTHFMVRTPFISTAYETDTNRILLSHEPTSSAYLSSAYFAGATAAHLLPSGVHRFTDSEDKIYCYVRFDDNPTTSASGIYDLSELSEDDYESFDGFLFVKAEVEPVPVYTDKSALSDPRVIIRLPGRVKPKSGTLSKLSLGALEKVWKEKVGFNDDEIAELADRAGGDMAYITNEGVSYIPGFVALPIKSNVDTYGPWYAVGSDGKVDYEQDESLVPWNYGGYTQMNVVGNAKVLTSTTYEQSNEAGTIVVPGAPAKNIGDQIVAQSGYPYITDINVSMGPNGVMTTYHLQQWTPRFGTTTKQQIERFQNQNLAIKRERKKISLLNQQKSRIKQTSYGLKASNFSTKTIPERERSSSSALIIGEVVPVLGPSGYLNPSGDVYTRTSFAEVVITPYYNALPILAKNYTRKGMASLDSIFRPFDLTGSGYIDTTTSCVLVPRYESPSDGASSPTSTDLNPYTEPHDMSMFIAGSSVPTNGLAIDASGIANDPYYRPIGLKLPMMGVGWGYDTDGNPVPADPDDSSSFVDNHRRRQDLWKVGPIDIRWSDSRKVWVASGGDSIYTVKLITDAILPGETAISGAVLMTGTDYATSGSIINLADPLYNLCALSGELFNVMSKNSRYEPVGEFGLFRTGISHTDVNPGGNGSVSISNNYHTEYVTAYDNIMLFGQIIGSGSTVHIEFDKTDKKFYFNQAACSGVLP